jgi:hypothetical protein
MAKDIFVYSTLSSSQRYTAYDGNKDLPREERSVLIKGGANVADKHFQTPRGVVTKITEEQLAFLKKDKMFQRHVERGFITYDDKQVDVEKVASNMEGRDTSSPLEPGDFESQGQAAPIVNSAPEEHTPPAKSTHPAAKKSGGNKPASKK